MKWSNLVYLQRVEAKRIYCWAKLEICPDLPPLNGVVGRRFTRYLVWQVVNNERSFASVLKKDLKASNLNNIHNYLISIRKIMTDSGLAKIRNCKQLPKINVALVIQGEKPPKVKHTGDQPSKALLKYVIWKHCVDKLNPNRIAKIIGVPKANNIEYWLKKSNCYTPRLKRRDLRLIRTKSFKEKVLALSQRNDSYEAIARKMGCNASTIELVAKEQGWDHARKREFEWKELNSSFQNTISDFYIYGKTIRHFSQSLAQKYRQYILGKDNLGIEGYDVDHRLSIYEAFYRGKRPVPWQLVAHPANLQVLTHQENATKNWRSDFSPVRLLKRVKKFNRLHGTVLLPVEIPNGFSGSAGPKAIAL